MEKDYQRIKFFIENGSLMDEVEVSRRGENEILVGNRSYKLEPVKGDAGLGYSVVPSPK
ncbi:hypothetical protein MSP8886_01574 [Marinomonas spartinae]|uniref:Uncharacterized protein n=1 Tax=Marinomonas spartinae TaxID=1792290 RepID=A0A1A8TA37_9GAMM|nr:hypothetical protein [Marinomonas spartinae]SBS29680.1 hypothetical protein MSP8886_01574 [Marinomonas spartinae]